MTGKHLVVVDMFDSCSTFINRSKQIELDKPKESMLPLAVVVVTVVTVVIVDVEKFKCFHHLTFG